MGMEIHGPNMGRYDAGYLTAVQREVAQSVKSGLLREVDDDVAKALLLSTTDAVNLSPEAKAYLRELRKKLKKKGQQKLSTDPDEADFSALLQGLEEFRDQDQESKEQETPKNPLFPSTITLSDHVPSAKRRKTRQYSPVRETLERVIYYAPSDKAREFLLDELEVMGFEIAAEVHSFGTKIIVIGKNMRLSELKIHNMSVVAPSERTFDGRPWDVVRGLYDNARRLLVIGEEQLGKPGRSVIRHEFAHAFDHAFSEKNHRKLPLSVQLWNLFAKQRQGMVSRYASTNPAEYFAESVEAFFREDGRKLLAQQDPKMHSYLQEMFRHD